MSERPTVCLYGHDLQWVTDTVGFCEGARDGLVWRWDGRRLQLDEGDAILRAIAAVLADRDALAARVAALTPLVEWLAKPEFRIHDTDDDGASFHSLPIGIIRQARAALAAPAPGATPERGGTEGGREE